MKSQQIYNYILNDDFNEIKNILNNGFIFNYNLFIKYLNINEEHARILICDKQTMLNYFSNAIYKKNNNICKLLINFDKNTNFLNIEHLKLLIINKQYNNALLLINNGINYNELDNKYKNIIFNYMRKVKLSKIINE